MQQQLINCFRFLNLRIYYAGVAVVVPFYMIFGRGFRSSYNFFRHRIGCGRLCAFAMTYQNFFRFGQVMIDRFATYAGKRFRIDVDDYESFAKLAAQPDSFMMLSAHTGNYEMAGYSLVSEQKPINAIVFAGETETVMTNRTLQFGRTNIRMIPIRPDMSHLFAINRALRDGEIVSMPADRCHGSERTVPCMFFGQTAKFPMGPFATIAQRNVPALAIFVMKESISRYHVFVHRLSMPEKDVSKRELIENIAQQYAAWVEKTVRAYPTQWFNFFDFWADPNAKNK
jgi:possible acyltransferase